jgi:DNA-binding NarL/FixJ family response regulator
VEERLARSEAADRPTVHTLVISQHDAVRRQLVAYLTRSPDLAVRGEPFMPDAIVRVRPDVVVLDLSRIGHAGLVAALGETRGIGARMVALASIYDLADERAVTAADGIYRLKTAGADGLAEIVRDAAHGAGLR